VAEDGAAVFEAEAFGGAARIEQVDDAVVVELAGEHDLATIDMVNDAFRAAEARLPRLLVVDLAACSFMDSTVVRALLLSRERAEVADCPIVLVVADRADDHVVATMLRVSGVGDVFEIYRSRAAALGDGRVGRPEREDVE
jgi:anti-anti-sigma factor